MKGGSWGNKFPVLTPLPSLSPAGSQRAREPLDASREAVVQAWEQGAENSHPREHEESQRKTSVLPPKAGQGRQLSSDPANSRPEPPKGIQAGGKRRGARSL